MLVRTWSNRSSHSLLGGVQNSTATSEDILVVCYKRKHAPSIPCSNTHLGIHTNEWKTDFHTKTCLQMFIAALFIIANIWKQPRCLSRVNGWPEAPADSGIILSPEKTWSVKLWTNMGEPWIHITKWKSSTWKGHIPNDSTYTTFWEKQNHGDSKKIGGCQGLGEGREE